MKLYFQKIFRAWWLGYSRYVNERISIPEKQDEADLIYLRERSFVRIITFVMPVTLVAFILRISLGIYSHQIFYPAADIVYYLVFCTVLLQKEISTPFKKLFIIFMYGTFSIAVLLLHGTTGPGVLFLTSTFMITVFIFPGQRIIYAVLINILIVLFITAVIYYRLFPTPLINHYTIPTWINYSFNLVFINVMCMLLVQQVIKRMECVIIKESELIGQLADEALEIVQLNNRLRESEDYYRYLFAANPIPMWVYDTTTLCFLQVNDAAVGLYGYSREEFLKMTIEEIRPQTEVRESADMVNDKNNLSPFKGNVMHLKKSNEIFPVEIRSNPIEINGKRGRLVLATDITERTKYIRSIETQNKKLKEIAWIQSHKVRAPLARVMSLTDLLSRSPDDTDKQDIMKYLMISADQLNEVITSVVRQAEESIKY